MNIWTVQEGSSTETLHSVPSRNKPCRGVELSPPSRGCNLTTPSRDRSWCQRSKPVVTKLGNAVGGNYNMHRLDVYAKPSTVVHNRNTFRSFFCYVNEPNPPGGATHTSSRGCMNEKPSRGNQVKEPYEGYSNISHQRSIVFSNTLTRAFRLNPRGCWTRRSSSGGHKWTLQR